MNNRIIYLLMTLSVIILSSCNIASEKKTQEARFDSIDSLLLKQSNFQSNTGIAVAIIQDTAILYNKGFGYANLSTKDTVTTKTMFHLGSVPKSFTAVALMQLVEQNKVSLDSLVIKYIPELKFKDQRYKKITVRQLANHTSGIYTYHPHDWDNPKTNDDALDQYVRNLNYDELRFNPGEKFSYSDTNYDIIGDIIYRVTGIPFEDYMKKQVLEPSGMPLSTFYLPDTSTVAKPYIDNYKNCIISRGLLYPVNREHAPCGTLFSNSTEMCNWMMMNIHKGKFGNRTIVSESTHDTLWSPVVKTGWGSTYYESMGIGWFIGTYNKKTVYLHSGNDHGYRAIFCIIPEDKYGVVILSNYSETAIHYLLDRILSQLYNVDCIDKSSDLIQENEYNQIVGTYFTKEKKVGEIKLIDHLLYFTFENKTCCLSSVREGNILAGKYKEGIGWAFYYDQANVFLSKYFDKNGKVNYMISCNDLVFEKNEIQKQ